MASPVATTSPFTKAVVNTLRKLYPEELADKSFDNTGLLLESPHRSHLNNSVLLTIDLTKAVADEAIKRKDSLIIAYHPIIFRGLKSLTLANTQQTSLLRLAQEGISVYCPHTAVDAALGGLTAWLCDVITLIRTPNPSSREIPHERTIITPISNPPPGVEYQNTGHGRIVRFEKPQKLGDLVEGVKAGLKVSHLFIAIPQTAPRSDIEISSVGICAGSGGDMLNNLDVDLLFTGELSHHEALAAIEKGKCVITAFHSNSERQYLKDVMKPELEARWKSLYKEQGALDVAVSKVDRDPYEVFGEGEKW